MPAELDRDAILSEFDAFIGKTPTTKKQAPPPSEPAMPKVDSKQIVREFNEFVSGKSKSAGSPRRGTRVPGDAYAQTFPDDYIATHFKPNQCGVYVRKVLQEYMNWPGKKIQDIKDPKYGVKVDKPESGTVVYLKPAGKGTTYHWALVFRGADGKLYLNELVTNNANPEKPYSVNQKRTVESVAHRIAGIYKPRGITITDNKPDVAPRPGVAVRRNDKAAQIAERVLNFMGDIHQFGRSIHEIQSARYLQGLPEGVVKNIRAIENMPFDMLQSIVSIPAYLVARGGVTGTKEIVSGMGADIAGRWGPYYRAIVDYKKTGKPIPAGLWDALVDSYNKGEIPANIMDALVVAGLAGKLRSMALGKRPRPIEVVLDEEPRALPPPRPAQPAPPPRGVTVPEEIGRQPAALPPRRTAPTAGRPATGTQMTRLEAEAAFREMMANEGWNVRHVSGKGWVAERTVREVSKPGAKPVVRKVTMTFEDWGKRTGAWTEQAARKSRIAGSAMAGRIGAEATEVAQQIARDQALVKLAAERQTALGLARRTSTKAPLERVMQRYENADAIAARQTARLDEMGRQLRTEHEILSQSYHTNPRVAPRLAEIEHRIAAIEDMKLDIARQRASTLQEARHSLLYKSYADRTPEQVNRWLQTIDTRLDDLRRLTPDEVPARPPVLEPGLPEPRVAEPPPAPRDLSPPRRLPAPAQAEARVFPAPDLERLRPPVRPELPEPRVAQAVPRVVEPEPVRALPAPRTAEPVPPARIPVRETPGALAAPARREALAARRPPEPVEPVKPAAAPEPPAAASAAAGPTAEQQSIVKFARDLGLSSKDMGKEHNVVMIAEAMGKSPDDVARALEASGIRTEITRGRKRLVSDADIEKEWNRPRYYVSDEEMAASYKRIGEYGSRLGAGVDPRAFVELVKIGVGLAERGFQTFKTWSRQMVRQLGSWVQPSLGRIWARVRQRLGSRPRVQTGDPVVDRLVGSLREARRLERLEQAERLHAARQRQAARLHEIYRTTTGEESYVQAARSMRGEIPRVRWEPIRDRFSEADINHLYEIIRTTDRIAEHEPMTRMRAQGALTKLLVGELPVKSEIDLLQRVFGPELVREVLRHRTRGQKVWDVMVDVMGVKKAVMASMDLSAVLRQGGMLMPTYTKEWRRAWRPMLKALVSDENYESVMRAIRSDPEFASAQRHGLFMGEYSTRAAITQAEEMFVSRFVEQIPGISHSARAYTAFLNQLRFNVWKRARATYMDIAAPSDWDDIARAINILTGRGTLGKLDKAHAAAGVARDLATVLWSPRFLTSRFQSFAMLASPNPIVRSMAAKVWARYVFTTFMFIKMMELALGAEVDWNPISTDFAKPKIGNLRLDPWQGFSQIVRTMARITTRKKITPSRATPEFADGIQELLNFTLFKASATPSDIADIMRGRTMTGEPANLDIETLKRMLLPDSLPMVIQDAMEAWELEGADAGLLAGAASFVGIGASTYRPRRKITLGGVGLKTVRPKGVPRL